MRLIRLHFMIFVIAVVGSGFTGYSVGVYAADQQSCRDGDICFYWAFGAIVRSTQGSRLVPIESDAPLKTGDRFKIMLELQKKCFIYVIHQNPQGGFQLLFPYNLKQVPADHGVDKRFYIPRGDIWFELDEQRGIETFYLMASAERLNVLEKFFRDYDRAEQNAEKEAFEESILAEIRRVRVEHRQLKAQPERPVQIVGNLRGLESDQRLLKPDIASIAVQVSAKKFFSRIFTIDHK